MTIGQDLEKLEQQIESLIEATPVGPEKTQLRDRFEDLIADPIRELNQLYRWLELEPSNVRHVRLQHRKRIDASGNHRRQSVQRAARGQ